MKVPNYQRLALASRRKNNDFWLYIAFLHDASAERGAEIACRLSVRPSVCL